ncbi:MAG: MBL fold metallo-hydrolase [Eubacteriales bacterium]|jgi:7,8-dihydropterin-6-yl-methyl-4-(beta-D-ribofuranosyl)aminobenzene 5'-phosphate synthase
MKMTVLVENNTYMGLYYQGEPGLCLYIEDEGTRLLLDTGYTDLFARNAQQLGVDLTAIDKVILSHGHDDHTGGLETYFSLRQDRPVIVTHPLTFQPKRIDGRDAGSRLSREQVEAEAQLCLTESPMKVSPNIWYLGHIPRTVPFENQHPLGEVFVDGQWKPDFMEEDSALVYQTPHGIYVITGCSHCGVCNIVAYAQKVCGDDRVLGLFGGFHLVNDGELTQQTAQWLAQRNIEELFPCHCTCFEAQVAMHRLHPIQETGVGLEVEWT